MVYSRTVAKWTFLTNHARAMLFIAEHPDARLRDVASALNVTERTAFGIVADLNDAGYVLKERDGRRNRYQIQAEVLLDDPVSAARTIGDVLDLLVEARGQKRNRRAGDEKGTEHDPPGP
ncbi:MAG: helix-turn-helix domain-containing protein [Acidimicrobiales bacterium]